MSMIDIHSAALDSKIASYHEFLARYSRRSRVVYGFVEGKEDPSFYRGFIELLIPQQWEVELWAAGNKDQVYRIHADMDWRRFPKTRVCFFVDRDLSGLIPESRAADVNIYLTDGYSIENAIVGRGMCLRVLIELYGFGTVPHGELETVIGLFERELEAFLKKMVPVMAWILAWRRRGSRANLNDIVMRDLFRLDKGCLQPASAPGGKASVAEYMHERCRVAFDTSIDIRPIEAEFILDPRFQTRQ